MLPNRDELGRRVVFHRLGVISAFSPTDGHDSITLQTSSFETFLQGEENQIRGIVHVSDVSGLGLQHLTMFTPQYYFRIGKNTEVTKSVLLSQ